MAETTRQALLFRDDEEMLEDAFWQLTAKNDAVLQVVDSAI